MGKIIFVSVCMAGIMSPIFFAMFMRLKEYTCKSNKKEARTMDHTFSGEVVDGLVRYVEKSVGLQPDQRFRIQGDGWDTVSLTVRSLFLGADKKSGLPEVARHVILCVLEHPEFVKPVHSLTESERAK